MSADEYTGAHDVSTKIAKYKDDFRPTAEKLHAVIMKAGGTLYPRLWYGMPGYAKTQTGPVLLYFRKDKYVTFGITESANVEFDDTAHSAEVSWYFADINEAAIAKIKAVVQKATR